MATTAPSTPATAAVHNFRNSVNIGENAASFYVVAMSQSPSLHMRGVSNNPSHEDDARCLPACCSLSRVVQNEDVDRRCARCPYSDVVAVVQRGHLSNSRVHLAAPNNRPNLVMPVASAASFDALVLSQACPLTFSSHSLALTSA